MTNSLIMIDQITKEGGPFMKKTSLLVADASEELRSTLVAEIMLDEELNLVGSTNNGDFLLELIQKQEPDVVVMDLILKEMDGLQVLESLENPKPHILVYTSVSNDDIIRQAEKAGADNIFLKPCQIPALLERVKEMAKVSRFPGRAMQGGQSLEYRIMTILQEIGIPAKNVGYTYLREAIRLTVENMDLINAITKELYPAVAKRFETTHLRVESGIRRAIGAGWNRGDKEVLMYYFGHTVCHAKNRPTNGEFIATIANRIKMEMEMDPQPRTPLDWNRHIAY